VLGSNALFDFLRLESKTYGIFTEKDLRRISQLIKESTNEIAYDIMTAEADKLANMVKDEIRAQPPAWPPLNEDYKKWKDRVGLNTDMLRATDAYFNAIAIQETRDSKGRFISAHTIGSAEGFTIRVGVPYTEHPGLDEEQGGDEDKKNLKYTELAEILEFGTDKIPARPHWFPAYRRWRSQHARSIKARIKAKAIRRFTRNFTSVIVPQRKAKKTK